MNLTKTNQKEKYYPSLLTDFFDTENFFGKNWLSQEMWASVPAVNVKENEQEFSLEFAAPGFSKKDFRVQVDENVLTISAEKKEEKKEKDERFTRREFHYNSFSRSFTLPRNTVTDKADARYADGILTLVIPKKKETNENKRKEISIA